MRLLIAAIGLIMVSTPAIAGPILWRDIEAGASEASIRERFPKSKDKQNTVYHWSDAIEFSPVKVTSNCKASAKVKFEKGIVDRVNLSGGSGFCGEEILTSLTAKYGEPKVTSGDGAANPESGFFVWIKDGVSIRFQKSRTVSYFGGKEEEWKIRYSVVEATPDL